MGARCFCAISGALDRGAARISPGCASKMCALRPSAAQIRCGVEGRERSENGPARTERLHQRRVQVKWRSMKFLSAMIVWFVMGAIITTGIVMAVSGKPVLLFIGLIGFIVAVGRIGCATH